MFELRKEKNKKPLPSGFYVGTIENGSDKSFFHTDHLGGTQVITDELGTRTQMYDYYPFGETRIEHGTSDNTKQYTGYTKDELTNLHYAGARYYANEVGRFVSLDPANLRLGTNLKEQRQLLVDPQQLNTYSYVRNNPVKYNDPSGEILPLALLGTLETALVVSPAIIAMMQYLPALAENPELTARMAPGTSDVIDGYEFATGNNIATGEKLSSADRGLAGLGLAVPVVGAGVLKPLVNGGKRLDTAIYGVSRNVHDGAQGKHIVGHNNYNPAGTRGVISSNPQDLLNQFHAGDVVSAEKITDVKTRVDFGQSIGMFKNQSGESISTQEPLFLFDFKINEIYP